MNILILGNNPKHAKIFSLFADNVYLMIQFKNKEMNRISQELQDYKIINSDIEYGTSSYYFKRRKEISSIIKKYNIDMVFSNRRDDMIQAKLATFFMKKKPLLLVTFHNSVAWTNEIKVKIMSILIKYLCDGCICLANFMYEKLVKYGISKEQLIYLPNTIQYENFLVKNDYTISEKVKICYTAVVYPLKNQELIIKVINKLKNKYDFEVHFYGDHVDKNYYQRLKKKIKEYDLENSIFLDGRVGNDDIRKLLPENDIYLSSTTIEMSPYNILEAKASGLPILATNVVGQKDLITDGEDGILYDITSVDDCVSKLEKLILNKKLRERIGRKARYSVAYEKSYTIASKKMKIFIEKLMKK